MKLRCLTAPNRHLVVGRRYEVAEILECPFHAMVRKPNGKWPKPGEPYFGLHPDEYFETPRHGIPALSCGYQYVEMEYFGAVIPNSIFATPRRASLVEPPAEFEHISDIVNGIALGPLWWLSYHGVLPKVCSPDHLEQRFLLLGIDHDNLGRQLSYRAASVAIRTVMRRLQIPLRTMPAVEDQQLEFWTRSWRPPGMWQWKPPQLSD